MIKSVVLIFLGDFFFDARCINMANTIINSGMELNIIDAGKSDNKYRGKDIYHISLHERGLFKYIKLLQSNNPDGISKSNLIYSSQKYYTQ